MTEEIARGKSAYSKVPVGYGFFKQAPSPLRLSCTTKPRDTRELGVWTGQHTKGDLLVLSCYSTGTETALTQQLGFVFCLEKPHLCSPSHPFVPLCFNKVPTTSPCAVMNTLTCILSRPGAGISLAVLVTRHFTCGTWLFQDTHKV